MNRLIRYHKPIARAIGWIGISVIIVLSVIPANDRPVTGAGQLSEHLAAFLLVGLAFFTGYRVALMRSLSLSVLFCGGVELLQVPLSTRHARVSDFVIDLFGCGVAIGLVYISEKLFAVIFCGANARNSPTETRNKC